MIDLDAFGRVLKEGGVVIADSILLTIHRRIMRFVADDAILARIGRSRFGILSQPLDDPRLLTAKIEEVRDVIRAAITIVGQKHVQTASIGVAFWLPGGPSGEEVLRAAEDAMWTARDCGGDQIEVLSPPRRVFKPSRYMGLLRRRG